MMVGVLPVRDATAFEIGLVASKRIGGWSESSSAPTAGDCAAESTALGSGLAGGHRASAASGQVRGAGRRMAAVGQAGGDAAIGCGVVDASLCGEAAMRCFGTLPLRPGS